MTALSKTVTESVDAKTIVDTMPFIEGDINAEKYKRFQKAAIECNAISLECLEQKFEEAIKKAYHNELA